MNPYSIIIRPVLTEKTNVFKEKYNKYVFIVNKNANKIQIKNCIEKLFNVDVLKINTLIKLGKLRRRGRYSGYKPDKKYAVIEIEKGQKINLVEESK